jgi:hypothetical protein
MRKGQYEEEQIIGVPRLTGAGSSWPFLYQGMEHEITDPAPLYFERGANVYNPMLQRELSQLGQQGIAGPPTAGAGDGDMGNGFGGFGPSQGFGNPGGLSGGRIASNLLTVAHAPFLFGQGGIGVGEPGPLPIPGLGGARDLISFVTSLFDDGGDGAETPRQARHSKHPAYGRVIGVSSGLIVTQESKVYPTIDDAVRAAQPKAVDRSRLSGREAYGFIYPSGAGYTYSGPFDTNRPEGGCIFYPDDAVASYHTHPPYGVGLPSESDLRTMLRSRRPMYILTVPPDGEPPSNGGIFRYTNPNTDGFMLP